VARATLTSGDDRSEVSVEIQPSSGVVLGEPMMYGATPAATSPLRPVAVAEFRRTERAHVEWPIAKPLDRREARLLTRTGQALPVNVLLTERSSAAGTVLAADLTLAPLAPGDYVIEVVATSGAASDRKLLAIRVVR
jgi:hypothetical protein